MYVFGYGSLMNKKSREKTLPGKRLVQRAALKGYQRKINSPVNGYLYLNLVSNPRMDVRGILIQINPEELKKLKQREVGYKCVDASRSIVNFPGEPVFVFIAPDKKYPTMKVPRSYIATCLKGVPASERDVWLLETIVENEIEEDLNNPVYMNAATK